MGCFSANTELRILLYSENCQPRHFNKDCDIVGSIQLPGKLEVPSVVLLAGGIYNLKSSLQQKCSSKTISFAVELEKIGKLR